MKLDGKVAIITGAARGLGRELVTQLAAAGMKIIAVDFNEEELTETVCDIGLDTVYCEQLDVRDDEAIKKLVDKIAAEHGRIDVLINNAGVNVTADTETLSPDEWDRIVQTNLRGPYVFSHYAFPHMKKNGGHIINIASSLAKRVKENSPAYVASKWGLLGLSQLMLIDGRDHGIKVTAFSPAAMRTNLLLDRFPGRVSDSLLDPSEVATTIKMILELPQGVAVPDIFVISSNEKQWP